MASGKINGKVTGTSADKYDFWVEWSSTPNNDGYSLVNATAYLRRNDGYAGSAYNLNVDASGKYITVNGKRVASSKDGIDTRNGAKVVIASAKGIKVTHDSDGYASVKITAGFPYVVSNLSGGSLSKTVNLGRISTSGAKISVALSNITQSSFDFKIKADSVVDRWYYSIDGGKWVSLSATSGTSYSGTISNLSSNTRYSVSFKVRRKSNQKETISSFKTVSTLPVYVERVQLTQTAITELDVGESRKLYYEVYPSNASDKSVLIESDNPSVISVSGDTITALKRGRATIILWAKDRYEVAYYFDVDVISRVERVVAFPREITMPPNTQTMIRYSVIPNDANNKQVSFASSNESVAKVIYPFLYSFAEGTAEITVTTEDGGKTDTYAVTVSGNNIWHDYSEPLDVLNAEDLTNLYENTQTIRNMLIGRGYSVAPLHVISASVSTPLKNVIEILRDVEYNLDVINDNDLRSAYYMGSRKIGDYAPNKEDIWRWIQVLDDMYNILTGQIGRWQVLVASDGYPTIDGQKIIVRGDLLDV